MPNVRLMCIDDTCRNVEIRDVEVDATGRVLARQVCTIPREEGGFTRSAGDPCNSRMDVLTDFARQCIDWLHSGRTFGFDTILIAARSVFPEGFNRSLAEEFEVAESTIDCWAKGTAHPHPYLQNQVVRSLLWKNGFGA
jgi:hypothetical protein